MSKKEYKKPSDEELKKILSPLQYAVTQKEATEHAFNNEFWDEKRKGLYVDIVTGEPLFSSEEGIKLPIIVFYINFYYL